jgi:hypothetical protein
LPACQSAATPGRSDGAGQRRAQKGRSEPRLLPHQITSAIFTTQDQHLINFGPSTSSICRTRTVVVGIKLSDLRSQDVPLPTGRGCFHVGGVRPAHPIMKREGAKKKKRKKKRGVHPPISPKFVLDAAYTSYVACRRGGVGTCVRGCKWTREPRCGSAPAPRFRGHALRASRSTNRVRPFKILISMPCPVYALALPWRTLSHPSLPFRLVTLETKQTHAPPFIYYVPLPFRL